MIVSAYNKSLGSRNESSILRDSHKNTPGPSLSSDHKGLSFPGEVVEKEP